MSHPPSRLHPHADHTTSLKSSLSCETCREEALPNREHQESGGTEPLHKMAQVSCQLVARPRLCCPLRGTRVPVWERERGRVGIFHPPPPGDSEESKICSQLVLLLRPSFLSLSRAEQSLGDICLPPLPCLVPRSHDLLPLAPPEALCLPGSHSQPRDAVFLSFYFK